METNTDDDYKQSGKEKEEPEGLKKEAEELSIENKGKSNADKEKPISKELDNRFSITEKGSKTLYSYSNDPDRVAFTEKENKLIANDNNPALIKNMIEVAESKGWEKVTITGDKEFKREAWIEAKSRGLEVSGYKPSPQDERKLERLLEKQNSIQLGSEKSNSKDVSEATNSDINGKEQTTSTDDKEGIEQREKELKTAFKTLDKKEALEKYPELKKVYELAPSASAFYKVKGGIEAQEEDFKSKASDKAIKEIAEGRNVPDFDPSSYKEQQTQKETSREHEIDY